MHRGIGRYSMALAQAMARNSAGHEVRIVLNEAYPDSVDTVRQAFDGLLPQARITTFATPLPTSEIDPRNGWRLRAAERIRAHYLATLQPDIVHVASLFEGLGDNSVVTVPPADTGYLTAVTMYDLIPLMRKDRYLRDPNVAAWYQRKLEQMQRAGLLLAISESARSEALALLEVATEDVVNISSAVDAMFRPLSLADEERAALLARYGLTRDFVMYTGGIDYRKNIEGLIEAFARLPAPIRRRHQLAVVCSVPDPDRIRLLRLAASLDLAEDELVLTGFVPDTDLVALYNCTALFVFPSLHEGFGLPALEAMACGAPVIGSNCSSIPEVIGRADALFDPTDPHAISASMAAVLDSRARQAELRAHGLSQARRFSWDDCARRALAAFEESLCRRPSRGVPPPHGGIDKGAQDTLARAEQQLIADLGADGAGASPADLLQTAASIASNRPRKGMPRVLIDIDGLAQSPSGHERLHALLASAPDGWRIEPVRRDGERYRFARHLTQAATGSDVARPGEAVVEAHAGDVLVTLGEGGEQGPVLPPAWRARGVLHRRLAAASLDLATLALPEAR